MWRGPPLATLSWVIGLSCMTAYNVPGHGRHSGRIAGGIVLAPKNFFDIFVAGDYPFYLFDPMGG